MGSTPDAEARRWAIAVLFVAGASLALIVYLDRIRVEEGALAFVLLGVTVLAGLAAGALTRSPAVLILSFLPALIAAPFGFPDESDAAEPLPIWLTFVFLIPVYAGALGVGALLGARQPKAAAIVAITIVTFFLALLLQD
jgi:hypothetical protein